MSVRDDRLRDVAFARAMQVPEVQTTSNITFVSLAEAGVIDDTTAGEHREAFAQWEPAIKYAVGNIRRYDDKLYRCIQAHISQPDWTPDATPAMWRNIADPAEEWPEWSQPIGAADAYALGNKVSHDGEHWISAVDNNVWEPGVYGWNNAE